MTGTEYVLTKMFLRFFYILFKPLMVNERKILFATPRNDVLQGNLKYINDEIKRQGLNYKSVFLIDSYGYSFFEKIRYLFKLVRGLYHVQTSGIVFLDNAYLPVHLFPHKKATKVIQTWHACGSFKKFGRSTLGLKDGIKGVEADFLHKYYDYAVCTSQSVAWDYSQAFGVPLENVIPIGAPRTDFFFDEKKVEKQRKKVLKDFPDIKNKKVILYAPTFRGRGKDKHSVFPIDTGKFLKELGDEYILLVKPHPHAIMKNLEKNGENILIVPSKYPLNGLLTATDVLLTDYSSAIFEFALLNKPMVFFPYDLEEYEQNSAFYKDYKTFVPGPIAYKEEDLMRIIKNEEWKDYDIDKFARENFDHLDGKSSERLVNKFLKPLNL
ncbi:CDP-glycerol glycerophosphotransferase family protein [Alkalibacter mobilis]|uniref:CDP-glycerol glycerophosphotransferase family protein n=1 Tax=Alkalibacter mobilis TaxID=2787712 RepID=UPI00189ED486|nr:CDP-glycerol glycerophosphotransferase family protein [Alkalibacter mobilis]MBF7096143.1 CDP-glycerol glycerophosphotransferase family protein [Alkalibacter mobilis]